MDFRKVQLLFTKEDLHPFVSCNDEHAGEQEQCRPSSPEFSKDFSYPRTTPSSKKMCPVHEGQSLERTEVQHRRDNPTEKKDLLNAMIYGKDPKTGSTMRDDLIAANMQTFLVAGMRA